MSTFSSFLGTLNNDSLTGSTGRDRIDGGLGNDTLVGLAGSDTMLGGAGNDSMRGGLGNDFYLVDSLSDVVVENANEGRDTVVTTISYSLNVPQRVHVENLRVSNSVLLGLELTGNALNNGLAGGVGNDSMSGLGGNDQLYGYAGDDNLNGGEGNDTLDGGIGHDTLTGGNGNDYLRGGNGNDVLDGSSGSDTLDGGSGADTLKGGVGNQVYYLDDSGDVIEGETVGAGNDSIILSYALGWSDVTSERRNFYDMSSKATHIENLSVQGIQVGSYHIVGNDLNNAISGGYHHDVIGGGAGNDSVSGGFGEDILYGDLGNDLLLGGYGNDLLYGGVGNDVIWGESGHDWLEGDAGADTMIGGAGDDAYVVDDVNDQVIEQEDGGVDTVYVRVAGVYQLGDHIEYGFGENPNTGGSSIVTPVHILARAAGGRLSGTAVSGDVLVGGDLGNNFIEALGGADMLVGGSGSDLLVGDGRYAYRAAQDFNPNSNDDTLIAGAGDDVLHGGWGNDSMVGGDGNDQFEWLYYINGEAVMQGNDTMEGGAGSDHYHFVSHGLVAEGMGHDLVRDVGAAEDVDVLTIFNTSADGPFISPDHVSFKQSGNNLVVLLNGSSTHSMTWENFFNGAGVLNTREHRAEWIQFADGVNGAISTTWDLTAESGIASFLQRVTPMVEASVQAMSLRTAVLAQSLVQPLSAGQTIIGNSANNTLTGGAGDDSISGLAGNDSLIGNAGNDTLDGGTGRDTMTGGAGDDLYHVSQSDDVVTESVGGGTDWVYSTSSTYDMQARANQVENGRIVSTAAASLTGNTLNNLLQGNDANNSIKGGNGNDTLEGLAGNDTLLGELGNDSLYGGSGNDSLVGGDGHDVLDGGSGSNTLNGGAGDDVYVLRSDADQLDATAETATSGTDTVVLAAAASLASLDMRNDALAFVENYDASAVGVFSNVIGNALNNRMLGRGSMDGGAGDDTLESNGYQVTLWGGEGNDVLRGGWADDRLDGGDGVDTMEGGAGDDRYFVNDLSDQIVEQADAGYDWVIVRTANQYILGDNVEGGGAVYHSYGNGAEDYDTELTYAVNVKGRLNGSSVLTGSGVSGDILTGSDIGHDELIGFGGADSLQGGAGNDLLFGDYNYLYGGALYFNSVSNDDFIDGGEGNDVLVGGWGNDLMVGGAGDDMFDRYQYDDGFLYLADGNDTMRGGLGNDVFVVDGEGDQVEEFVGEGTDHVLSFLMSYSLTTNVENASVGETDNSRIGGSILDGASLVGNDLSNTLSGNIGADTLAGGAGNDTLIGGEGGDEMDGGLGDDVFYVDSFLDFVSEWANEGTDKVIASVDYVMDDNVEEVEYASAPNVIAGGVMFTGNELNNRMTGGANADTLVGNDGNDSLLGGAGNDVLNGGAGADRMEGGTENDTYHVDNAGDLIVENANAGTDTVVLATLLTYTMAANIESLNVGASTSAFNLTGNVLNNTITGGGGNDTIRGDAGNDSLLGGNGNDSLLGGAGNDVLSGGAGADRMEGGTENDTYHVDNAGDVIVENANAGTDLVVLSTLLTYTLAANVENLNVGTSASAFTLTGNVLNNSITGGNGNDSIRGGAGNDTLRGGAGSDQFVFDTALGSANQDTVADFTKSQGDKIAVDDAVFTKLVGKTNLSTHFRLSTAAAVGGDDFLVYNTGTGQLFYDATGSSNNTSTMQLFAILSTKPLDLTGTDFVVI